MDVSNCSIGQPDSELDGVVSPLAHCVLDAFDHPAAILWMDPLQHRFAVRKALLRIEAPNSEIFLRPIQRRCRVEGPAPRMREPLRFRQITLASPQRFFRTLTVADVHYRPNKLDFARLISFSMSHNVDMFDGTIRHHQAIFMLKILSILRRAIDGLSH